MARQAIIVRPKPKPKSKVKEQVIGPNGKPMKPGTPATPGNPGVKNIRATPYLTPDQSMGVFDRETAWTHTLNDAEDAFEDLQTDAKLQTANINRTRDEAVRRTKEAMAARGLFRSSLKDTALIDSEKAAEQQRTAIDNMLITAQGRLADLRVGINREREAFGKITNDMMIGNAEEINSTLPEYAVEPTPGTPGTPGRAAKPGSPKKPAQRLPTKQPPAKAAAPRTKPPAPHGKGGRITTPPRPRR